MYVRAYEHTYFLPLSHPFSACVSLSSDLSVPQQVDLKVGEEEEGFFLRSACARSGSVSAQPSLANSALRRRRDKLAIAAQPRRRSFLFFFFVFFFERRVSLAGEGKEKGWRMFEWGGRENENGGEGLI